MPLIVHYPTLKHYVDLLTETNFLLWTWNTFLVAENCHPQTIEVVQTRAKPLGIDDLYRVQVREVDHQPAGVGAVSERAVTTGTHGDLEAVA